MAAPGTVSRRADAPGVRVSDRSGGAVDPGRAGDRVHLLLRRDYPDPRMVAVRPARPGLRDLGRGLLRRLARRPAFGDPGHAGDGPAAAHLDWRTGLFRARRGACGAVL